MNPNFNLDGIEPKGNLSPKEIQDKANEAEQYFQPVEHRKVLNELLKLIEPINFRKEANLKKEDEKLKSKHLLVLSIEVILKITKKHNWGLCKKYESIYLFNGACWKVLTADDIKSFLGKASEKLSINKFNARFYSFREQLYKQFLCTAYLPEPERPKDVVLINLQNGTYEITPTTRQLRAFNRRDFITYQLPFKYDESAKAPLFQKYLDQVQPDKEGQGILAEYLAYLFAKHLKLEKALLLYGTGANGKSVFFEIVKALLGQENVSNFSLESLTNSTGQHRAQLTDVLVNYSSEINGKLESSLFKQLVSGEPVEARKLFCEPFSITNYARLIFNCNDLPSHVEHTNAFFRRFMIVKFGVTIPEEEQDKELANKIIKKELSGVFNWVLDGLERLLAQGKFSKCDAVKREVEQYRLESDTVRLFLEEENFKPSLENTDTLKDLFYLYKSNTLDNGQRPVSKKNFSKRLLELKYEIKRRNYGNVVFIEKNKF